MRDAFHRFMEAVRDVALERLQAIEVSDDHPNKRVKEEQRPEMPGIPDSRRPSWPTPRNWPNRLAPTD